MDSPDGTSSSKSKPSKTITPVPVSKESIVYNMDFRDRRVYIFNQVNFKANLGLGARPESTKMATELAEVLIELNFNFVQILTDMTYDEIEKKLTTISQDPDLEKCACILVVVMTHGIIGGIYAYDTHYMPNTLETYFSPEKCKWLTGKPKLFIIQACRGNSKDVGITVEFDNQNNTENSLYDGSSSNSYKLSTHADCLTAYATVENFVAHRIPFITILTEELSKPEVKDGTMDFLSMLTIVQKRVSFGNGYRIPGECDTSVQNLVNGGISVQIPSVISTLTRKFFFKNR